jgi:hypothetical protein
MICVPAWAVWTVAGIALLAFVVFVLPPAAMYLDARLSDRKDRKRKSER